MWDDIDQMDHDMQGTGMEIMNRRERDSPRKQTWLFQALCSQRQYGTLLADWDKVWWEEHSSTVGY